MKWKTFLIWGGIFLCVSPALHAADISHIGTDQQVQVICVTYDDFATTRLTSCSDWANLLNNEIGVFYDQATDGKTTFVFNAPVGAPDNGWLSLGYDSTDYDFWETGQDAIDLADPHVDFSSIHRVAVITNKTDFGGQGISGGWWATDEGAEQTFVEDGINVDKRYMSLSIVNEWLENSFSLPFDEAASVVGHELGHHLDVKTHYGTIGWFPGTARRVITPWDIMGLSPYRNHFHAWAKFERQWIEAGSIQLISPPDGADIDMTILLSPSESSGGTKLIEVSITNGAVFTGYTVEYRRQINGDENLPSEGVLVSFVDENPNTIRKAIVLYDPGSPGDLDQAPLEVGDTYTDTERNLTITYVSQSGDDANVRIEYLEPPALPPNPPITPWGSPPWETVDIWLDSEKNGWDTYRYTDGSGNPVGNGDDAWVDHDNRVYFRITNGGTGDATNVRVRVYANEPPGMGDSGADWRYLGTAVFPTITAGNSEVGFVNWKPVLGEHTCLKVVIIDSDLEITTLDNIAQENVTAFDTSAGSPYRAQCQRFTVNNPFEFRHTPVHMMPSEIPDNWIVQVEPTDFTLAPASSDQVCVMVFPSEPDETYAPGFIGKLKLEAQVPFANTFIPIGGVDIWIHLTTDTALTCDSNGSARLDNYPEGNPDTIGSGLAPLTPIVDSDIPPYDAESLESFFKDAALIRPAPPWVKVGVGESIEASGRLEPGFSGAVIAVDITSGERRETQLMNTDSSGQWNATFDPEIGGVWEVQAFYAGDSTHAAAQSNRCRFDVERPEGSEACGLDERIVQWLRWLALVVVVVALCLFYAAYRSRLCWLALMAIAILILFALASLNICWQLYYVYSGILIFIALVMLIWWYRFCRLKFATRD